MDNNIQNDINGGYAAFADENANAHNQNTDFQPQLETIKDKLLYYFQGKVVRNAHILIHILIPSKYTAYFIKKLIG